MYTYAHMLGSGSAPPEPQATSTCHEHFAAEELARMLLQQQKQQVSQRR